MQNDNPYEIESSAYTVDSRSRTSSSSLSWMRGFVQAVRHPEHMDALRHANVWKIYAAESLLIAMAYTLTSWMAWLVPALRAQMIHLLELMPGTQSAVALTREHFPWPSALGSTLVQTGLVGLGVQSLMMWTIQRIVCAQPLRMLAVLGVTSFTASISVVGYVLTVAVQVAGGSMTLGFSPAPFFDINTQPFLVTYLQKFDLFLLWQYLVIGVSIAAFANQSRAKGFLVGALGVTMHAMFSASLAYVGYQIYQTMKLP